MKNIIITGGHSGIGLELTRRLLQENHRVGLVVRDEPRKQEARATLGAKVDFFLADLSDQVQVRQVAEEINTSWEKVDVLFNNAGVLLADMQRSKQGNELHYEVNTLSPFLLTTRLKPALDRSAYPVVVNTVADFAAQEKGINYEELLRPKKIKKLFGSYMQSKLAITALMKWLAEQPDWQNVRIVSVTPGANKTKMTASRGMPAWLVPLRNLFFAKPTKGANLLYQGAFGLPARQSGTFLKGNKVHPLKFTPSRSDINQLLSGLQRSYLKA